MVEVEIAKPISEIELEKIAYKIRDGHRTKFDRTFIGWRRQDISDPSGMYWATTHFNPDLKVEILFYIENGEIIYL